MGADLKKIRERFFSKYYATRFSAGNMLLKQLGLPEEISEYRKVFSLLCAGDDTPGPEDQKGYEKAWEMLEEMAAGGRPPDFSKMSQEELDERLLDACYFNKPDMALVRELIKHGADPFYQEPKHGRSVLLYAGFGQRPELLRLLLELGADVNTKHPTHDLTIWTAAIGWVDWDLFKLCIEKGADLDATDNNGRSVLMLALVGRKAVKKKFKLLLKLGASPQSRDQWGRNLIFYALYRGANDILEQLLKEPWNPREKTDEGLPLLSYAVMRKDTEAIQLLLKHGVDRSLTDHQGRTAYQLALKKGWVDIAKEIDPDHAEEDYENDPAREKIRKYKEKIIGALKAGQTYSSADKEGREVTYYEDGEFKYHYQEHQSDREHRHVYEDEEAVLASIFQKFSSYQDQRSEEQIYRAMAKYFE